MIQIVRCQIAAETRSIRTMPRAREEIIEKQKRVLWITLFLNAIVSISKILVGLFTGLLNLVADGVHSLFDSLNNIAGIILLNISKKPADEKYPYGYSKFETLGVIFICTLLLLAFFEISKEAVIRFIKPPAVSFEIVPFIVMGITIAVNIFIVWYENKKSKELKSEFLKADAAHTKSDIFISLGVTLGLILIKMGYYWVDPLASAVIALLILHALKENLKTSVAIVCDANLIPAEEIEKLVMSVQEIKFCHEIRTRGKESAFFMDCHIGVKPGMSVKEAHDISHRVKETLKEYFKPPRPFLLYATIHIEPDDDETRQRANSVFKNEDF